MKPKLPFDSAEITSRIFQNTHLSINHEQMATTNLSLENYSVHRQALINDDRSLRREFLPSSLAHRSQKEAEADRIVREIRTLEAETIWRADYPDIPHPFPGMEFLTGMLRSRTYLQSDMVFV